MRYLQKGPTGGGPNEGIPMLKSVLIPIAWGVSGKACVPWGLAWGPVYMWKLKSILGMTEILLGLVKGDRGAPHVAWGLLAGHVLSL